MDSNRRTVLSFSKVGERLGIVYSFRTYIESILRSFCINHLNFSSLLGMEKMFHRQNMGLPGRFTFTGGKIMSLDPAPLDLPEGKLIQIQPLLCNLLIVCVKKRYLRTWFF